MAVKFIIDSAADIIPSECDALGVAHLPLKVLFGEEEFADSVTITHGEFYEKLTTNPNHPTTSQVSPAEFEAAYERVTAGGDEAVVITISSKLSGTYQSAVIASEDYEGKVFVVDSLNATVGERALLRHGIRLAAEGLSAAEIAAKLDEIKTRIRLVATVDTLEYLKKGGRISSATAVVGGLLNIKPAIAVVDGVVETAGKARGAKAANALLRQLVEKSGGIDTTMPLCLAYSGSTDENLKKFMGEHGDLWEGIGDNLSVSSVGAVIGTHVGPGAVAVAFFGKE